MGIVRAFLLAVSAKLAADEAKSWLPSLSRCLLHLAVSRLPADQQARYAEEWAADLNTYPGDLVKIYRALGFIYASFRLLHLSESMRIFRSYAEVLRKLTPALIAASVPRVVILSALTIGVSSGLLSLFKLHLTGASPSRWLIGFLTGLLAASSTVVLTALLRLLARYRRRANSDSTNMASSHEDDSYNL